jgi:hypothetical protein
MIRLQCSTSSLRAVGELGRQAEAITAPPLRYDKHSLVESKSKHQHEEAKFMGTTYEITTDQDSIVIRIVRLSQLSEADVSQALGSPRQEIA